MSYLRDELQLLYTERAGLLERVQRCKDDPGLDMRVKAAAESPARGAAAMAELWMATMPAKVALDQLKEEIGWVERQILAILGNPALVNKYDT